MEELIGLLLVLLFGGIEAWNKVKKKKREQGPAQEGNPKRGEKKKRDFLPEAWPTVELDARPVAGCNEEEPVQTIAEVAPGMPPGASLSMDPLPAAVDAVPSVALTIEERPRSFKEPLRECGFSDEGDRSGKKADSDSAASSSAVFPEETSAVLRGTDISLRDAVVASVILERKYV